VLDTAAYAAGDVLAATAVISNVMRVNDGRANLFSLTGIDKSKQKPAMTILFYQTNVTSAAVNAANNLSDADQLNLLGFHRILAADWIDYANNSICCFKGPTAPGLLLEAATGTKDVYAVCILDAGTPTFAVGDLMFKLGVVQAYFLLRAPQTDGESTNIRFTGNPLSLSVANGTMTAHNYAAGTATIQANAGLVAPSTDKIILYFLPSSSAPVRLLPTITGTSADFNPNFLTHMGQLLGNGGGIRILDWNGGSLNSGVIDGDDNPFPTAVTTAANRNKLSSDDWLPQDGRDQFNASSGTRVNDGIPKEFCAMVANQIGAGYLHDNLTTNGDTTYYQAVAGIMANGVTGAPLPDGTTLNVAALTGDYVMELANEVGWNFNGAFWRSTVQFAREASESLLPPMSGTTFLFTASMAPDGATNSSILTVTGSPSGTITKDQYIGGVGVKGSTKIIATHADDATLTGARAERGRIASATACLAHKP
jgi:hypothetical protein